MIRKTIAILFIASFLFSGFNCFSQRKYPFYHEWAVGYNLGMTRFYGDGHDRNGFFSATPLSKFFYQDRGFTHAVNVHKSINSYFGLEGTLRMGNLKGTKLSESIYFKTKFYDYNLRFTANFTNMFMEYRRSRLWDIYGFVGIGFNESRSWKYSTVTDKLIGTNGFGSPKYDGGPYKRMTETMIPFGFGFNYAITNDWDVNVEFAINGVNTDKLDVFISDQRKAEGYGYMSVGLSYNFRLPKHWSFAPRYPSYNGKSSDRAIKKYNKKKRVIMKPKNKVNRKKFRRKRGNFFQRIFG